MSVTSAAERGALRPDTIETRASWVVALTALGIYSVIRDQTLLPVTMTGGRLAAVFLATLVMASISALLSLSSLRRADPAELF